MNEDYGFAAEIENKLGNVKEDTVPSLFFVFTFFFVSLSFQIHRDMPLAIGGKIPFRCCSDHSVQRSIRIHLPFASG